MKAYIWTDEYTGYSLIVWGDTAGQARRQVADSEGEDFIDVRVYRLPWADKYTSMDDIPMEEYFANGWRCGCSKCGELYYEKDLIVTDTDVICKRCAGMDGDRYGK